MLSTFDWTNPDEALGHRISEWCQGYAIKAADAAGENREETLTTALWGLFASLVNSLPQERLELLTDDPELEQRIPGFAEALVGLPLADQRERLLTLCLSHGRSLLIPAGAPAGSLEHDEPAITRSDFFSLCFDAACGVADEAAFRSFAAKISSA